MIIPMPARLDVQTAHRGRLLALQVVRWTDAQGRCVEREVVRHPGAVLIVPELAGDRVVMLRNHRVAVGGTLWELPAGRRDPGETPEAGARRELEEEVGLRAGTLEPISTFWTTPGFCDEVMFLFRASDLEQVPPRPEADERIEQATFTLDQALAMVGRGEIREGKTLVALLLEQERRAAR